MRKKGISPLIATILLIGFIIIIAVVVWFWYSNILEEQAQKTQVSGTGEYTCAADVQITVSNMFCTASDISFDIENKGTASLANFRVQIKGDAQQTLDLSQYIAPSGKINTGVQYDSTITGVPTEVTIIPVLGATTCSDKQITTTVDCPVGGSGPPTQ